MRPGRNPRSPPVEGFVPVSAGVKLFGTMQSAIHEIRSHIHSSRPFDRVRTNQSGSVRAKQMNEVGPKKTVVPDFDGVTNRVIFVHSHPRSAGNPFVVTPGKLRRLDKIPWKQFEKEFHATRVETQVRRELPENGAELVA